MCVWNLSSRGKSEDIVRAVTSSLVCGYSIRWRTETSISFLNVGNILRKLMLTQSSMPNTQPCRPAGGRRQRVLRSKQDYVELVMGQESLALQPVSSILPNQIFPVSVIPFDLNLFFHSHFSAPLQSHFLSRLRPDLTDTQCYPGAMFYILYRNHCWDPTRHMNQVPSICITISHFLC